jgi:ketosteroid isomerase-like protein
MSSENAEVVRRAAEAFNERDVEALVELTSADFVFRPYLGALLEGSTYTGHEGVRKYFADAGEAWAGIKIRIDAIRDFGDRLILETELYGQGRASGLEVRVSLAWIAELRDRKVTRIQAYEQVADALAAAERPTLA